MKWKVNLKKSAYAGMKLQDWWFLYPFIGISFLLNYESADDKVR